MASLRQISWATIPQFSTYLQAALGEVYRFSDLETERVVYEDLNLTVVTPRMLYRMKRDTARPKGKTDAAALRLRFDVGE